LSFVCWSVVSWACVSLLLQLKRWPKFLTQKDETELIGGMRTLNERESCALHFTYEPSFLPSSLRLSFCFVLFCLSERRERERERDGPRTPIRIRPQLRYDDFLLFLRKYFFGDKTEDKSFFGLKSNVFLIF
jgi:hypothetical protein